MQHPETIQTPREVISVIHLWAGYDSEPVLENINLSVRELDFVGLIGPNGGGKTTLLKVLLGLLRPTGGNVRIMGKSAKEGRRNIGYVPQSVELDRDFLGVFADRIDVFCRDADGRNDACRIARVYAGQLDVLHDCRYQHFSTIGDSVRLRLDGVFKELVY